MKSKKSSSFELQKCGAIDEDGGYAARTCYAARILASARTEREMQFAKAYVAVMVQDLVEQGYDASELYHDIASYLDIDKLDQWTIEGEENG